MRHGSRAGEEAKSAPLIPLCIEDLTWFCVEMSSKVNFLNIRRCLFPLHTETQLYKDNIIALAWSSSNTICIPYHVSNADSSSMNGWLGGRAIKEGRYACSHVGPACPHHARLALIPHRLVRYKGKLKQKSFSFCIFN